MLARVTLLTLCIWPAEALLGASGARRAPRPRMQSIEPIAVPATAEYLSNVALTMPPAALESCVGVLVNQGGTVVEPGGDSSIMPLLIPITRDADGELVGLLRWPAGGGGGSKLPLVRTTGGGQMLTLLASSMEHYLVREAAVADVSGADGAAQLASLSGSIGWPYNAGDAATSPGGLSGYLIAKVGPFESEYEALASGHLSRGSETAALVTCERVQACFGAWGRPFAFHARMLAGLGRDEEARDKARAALELPLWTLGDDLETILEMANTDRDALVSKLRLKADGQLTAEQLKSQNGMEKRTPQQIAKDRASYLLDLVVAAPSDYSWQSIRAELAELYRQADMPSIATFVDGEATL